MLFCAASGSLYRMDISHRCNQYYFSFQYAKTFGQRSSDLFIYLLA